jgi:hypothetical protein
MSSSLIEMTGEVTRGAELKVALDAPVLGITLRVLCHHFAYASQGYWEGGGGGGDEKKDIGKREGDLLADKRGWARKKNGGERELAGGPYKHRKDKDVRHRTS